MPETGTLIDGKYRILSKIREGGMGAIYKVHHSLLNEVRVIKVMRSQSADNPDLQRRFAQEAQLITRVRHRNICLIFDYAIDEEMTAYIVMEYIEGVSLAEWLKLSGPLDVPLALEITHQSLEALEYLHRKRVIHRDISPENIMLTTDHEGRLLVKLIDLGIAKALDADDGVTKTGVFIGKFKYSSPEQLMSDGLPLDGRSDLYSLAVVLYQMLTGHLPVRGETAHQLAAAHLFQPPIPFDDTDSEQRIPEEVRSTVLRALEKKRDDRFPDSTELLRMIESIQARLPRPDMVEAAAFMELVQSTSESAHPDHPTPTPSAQERLNRRFQPSDTPIPMASTIDAFPGEGEAATEIDENAIDLATDRDPTVVATQAAAPRRPFLIWGAALIVVAGITGAMIFRKPSDMPPEVPEPAGSSSPGSTTTATAPGSIATILVTPETAIDTATTATVSEVPPPVTTTTAKVSSTPTGDRNIAGQSRTRMLAEKNAAQTAGARDLATVIFSQAERAERQGENFLRAGRMDAASGSFLSALGLYQQAAGTARKENSRRIAEKESEARTLAAEAEKRRIEEQRREQEKKAALEKKPTPPPTVTPTPAVSEEPRVRSAIQRYIQASESLDADAYIAIFPSADRRRIESGFASLRAQTLSLDIRSVEISSDGQSATVRATETRVATPRAGSEQRVGGERTFTLSRRGANWVISTIR